MSNIDEAQLAKSVGKAIARYRQACGYTQDELAEHLGIGNEAVSRMERGIVIPTVTRLAELAEIFNCRSGDLLTEVSGRSSDQAEYLARLLSRLEHPDRELLVVVLEKFVNRLANKDGA